MPQLPDKQEASPLAQYQQAFADHLRRPDLPNPPSVQNHSRLVVYRRLVFNNFCSFLNSCFPITRSILSAQEWQQLSQTAFSGIRAHSPLFRNIPDIFLQWLQKQPQPYLPQYPWLLEFMHYEWLELVVETHAAQLDKINHLMPQVEDPLNSYPLPNPTLQLACYRWPVHTLQTGHIPTQALPDAHCFAVVRQRNDHIQFVSINALTAQLLQLLIENQKPLGETLQQLSQHADLELTADMLQFVQEVVQQMLDADVLLGWRKAHEPHPALGGDG
jgi:uncharacterized protein